MSGYFLISMIPNHEHKTHSFIAKICYISRSIL